MDGDQYGSPYFNVDALNSWLVNQYGIYCEMKKVNDYYGYGKPMAVDVFCAAVNHCNTDDLMTAFRAIKWDIPESAQLFVKEEGWDAFRLFNASQVDDGNLDDFANALCLDAKSMSLCKELLSACRQLLRYDGVDSARVREAIDVMREITEEILAVQEKE
ncbi:MAG: hypothetical protein ACKO0Z_01500 [Betaproteobacteria bacterium]